MSSATETPLVAAKVTIRPGSLWARLPALGMVLGLLGVGGVAWMSGRPQQFYFSYLTAFIYFLSLALGALFFVLVQHATRAGWSVVVRRAAEVVAATLPLFAVLFLPLLAGVHDLFHWTHADVVRGDELLRHRQPYLNLTFFQVRAALYFVVWTGLGLGYYLLSVRQDRTGEHAISRRLRTWSAPGLMLFALSLTFAAFDWVMSLDPHWYSTIFGVYFFAGSLVSLFAFLALLALGLRRSGVSGGAITVEHLHDLGKLLFAFTCFWAYIAFSQFMLMWYANIPEETVYFLRRLSGSWRTLSLVLMVGHFAAPFLFLLPRTIKRSGAGLGLGAVWMLVMHYADIYWLVMPNLHPKGMQPHLLDLACFVAVGGLFVTAAATLLRRAPVLPIGDPRLPESRSFENQ